MCVNFKSHEKFSMSHTEKQSKHINVSTTIIFYDDAWNPKSPIVTKNHYGPIYKPT